MKITRRRERRYRRWYTRTTRRESRQLGWPEQLSAHGVRTHIMPYDVESWDPGAAREATTGQRTPGAKTVFAQTSGCGCTGCTSGTFYDCNSRRSW